MTEGAAAGGSGPRGGEANRYREACARDPVRPGDLDRLLEGLDDPSWRVRRACAERLATAPAARVLPRLVEALGADGSPGRRAAAAEALAILGPPARAALEAALSSESPVLRAAAAEVLGEVGDRRAAGALGAAFRDPDANVRVAAAQALGRLGGEGALAALAGALEGPDAAVRRTALEALIVLRAPPPAARLAALAAERGLRRPALRLAGLCDEAAAQALLAEGLGDAARTVREAALAGAGELRLRGGPTAALEAALRASPPGAAAVAQAAQAATEAGDLAVRAGALCVLAWTGQAEGAPAIAAAAEDERLRALASEALAALGEAGAEPLRRALPGLPPSARVAAALELARLGRADALAELAAAAGGADQAARRAAFEALGRLGDPRAVPVLFPLLEDEDQALAGEALAALAELAAAPAARAAILEACRAAPGHPGPGALRLLGRVGSEAELGALCRALRAARPASRIAAAGALAVLWARAAPGRPPPGELAAALEDADEGVRAAAAHALGLVAHGARARGDGLAGVGRALALALGDPSPSVRAEAALALGRCGAAEHAGRLAEMARDAAAPAEAVAAAVHALADLGAAGAGLLEAAAAHAEPEVVKEAVRAATTLPGEPGSALLLRAAAHARWDVRRAAAAALRARREPALAGALRRLAEAERDPLVAEVLQAALRELEGRSEAR